MPTHFRVEEYLTIQNHQVQKRTRRKCMECKIYQFTLKRNSECLVFFLPKVQPSQTGLLKNYTIGVEKLCSNLSTHGLECDRKLLSHEFTEKVTLSEAFQVADIRSKEIEGDAKVDGS